VAAPTYIAKFSVVIFTKMQSLRPCTYLLSSLGLPGLCMFSVLLWFGSHCNYSHGKLHPNVERRRGEETHSFLNSSHFGVQGVRFTNILTSFYFHKREMHPKDNWTPILNSRKMAWG